MGVPRKKSWEATAFIHYTPTADPTFSIAFAAILRGLSVIATALKVRKLAHHKGEGHCSSVMDFIFLVPCAGVMRKTSSKSVGLGTTLN